MVHNDPRGNFEPCNEVLIDEALSWAEMIAGSQCPVDLLYLLPL